MTITPEEIEKLRELARDGSNKPWSSPARVAFRDNFTEHTALTLLSAYETEKAAREEVQELNGQLARTVLASQRQAIAADARAEKAEADLADAEKALAWLNGGAELQLLMRYNNELMARADRLAKALQPFARADRAIGDEPGPFRFETASGYRLIEREHLSAARAALAEEPKEIGNG